MNKLISISGSSGVGKTTIAKLLCMALPHDSSVLLSGDDLHLWERNHKNWEKITHLNPEANDLDRGYADIVKLKNNEQILRKCYRHDSGKFDENIAILPKTFIVYEGLHALYDARIRELSDIKMFVDTDDELKITWKIQRDTKKRGYSKEQVLDSINRRKNDELKYIIPQKIEADIIVKFKKEQQNVVLDFQTNNPLHFKLIDDIKEVYKNHIYFLNACNQLSNDIELAQYKGGNLSIKIKDTLIITSSGVPFKDISIFNGYSVCDRNKIPVYYRSESQYEHTIKSCSIFETNERPSMEIGVHNKLGHAVVHTHPIYLNCLLCCKEAKNIIHKIFLNYAFKYISYVTPGADLSNIIEPDCNIFFLENHGLIITHDDMKTAINLSKELNDISKNWLNKNINEFLTFSSIHKNEKYPDLFPDAAVLEINNDINSYIYKTIIAAGLTPNPLLEIEKNKLKNMEAEKYRKSLV